MSRRRARSAAWQKRGCLILDGDVEQGLALLDEVGVATVSGDLDPLSTGVVYCELVCALQGLAQYDAAEEWTEAMERWCTTNAIGSLRGRCRVHRAEILRLRGSCGEAETEALSACEELRPYLRREMGWPLSELGRIRFRRGDIDGAEEAFLAAHRAGWDPQPGLALVRLAQGDAAAAAASIRDALEHPTRVPFKERPPDTDLQRAPLLEAQVEIEIAAGDVARARSAADELTRVAARFESRALVGRRNPSLTGGCDSRRAIRRTRSGSAPKPRGFGARSGRRTRRRWRGPVSPKLSARAAMSTGPLWSSKRPARFSTGSKPSATADDAVSVEPDGGAQEPPVTDLNMFRREGDYWSVVFEGRTVRVRANWPSSASPGASPGRSGPASIGATGFEPATARPPAGCATRLRHAPKVREP